MRSLLFIVFPQSSSLGPGLGRDPVTRGRRQEAIDGSCSCAANHQKGRRRQQEEVVFITFSLLCSRPVHPEAELTMNHRDGHDHVAETPKDARRVSSPKMRPNPPKNSAAMARNANTAGMCRTPAKKPIVPVKP